MSLVPPRPTPITIGGQGLEPARMHASAMKSTICSLVAAGGEHLHRAHILRAEALGRDRDLDLIPRHDRGVEHAGRVVVGILAAQRIAHHGQAQVAVDIAAGARPSVTASSNAPPHKVHLLPHLGEHDRHAGVPDRSARRSAGARSQLAIISPKISRPSGRLFGLLSVHERLPQVGGQVIVGVHAQLPHEFCHFRNVDRSHVVLLYSSAPLMKTACT